MPYSPNTSPLDTLMSNISTLIQVKSAIENQGKLAEVPSQDVLQAMDTSERIKLFNQAPVLFTPEGSVRKLPAVVLEADADDMGLPLQIMFDDLEGTVDVTWVRLKDIERVNRLTPAHFGAQSLSVDEAAQLLKDAARNRHSATLKLQLGRTLSTEDTKKCAAWVRLSPEADSIPVVLESIITSGRGDRFTVRYLDGSSTEVDRVYPVK